MQIFGKKEQHSARYLILISPPSETYHLFYFLSKSCILPLSFFNSSSLSNDFSCTCYVFIFFSQFFLFLFALFFCRLPYLKEEAQQHKLLYLGLYLLIWGEASNLRFIPECLCYIFHHVSWHSVAISCSS